MSSIDQTINSGVTMGGIVATASGRFRRGDAILGRYAVIGELGEGGMGVVYRCLDKVGGVEVAVKGLPPEVSHNADVMEGFRANYQLVRALRHPNIAGVTSLEQDDGGDYYLVMDIAKGENLNRWMRKHSDAPADLKLAILRQIASALDYAHAEKIIHRDVKPENVMVDDAGRVKVLDFGLAAEIRSSQSRTSQAVTSKSGTPHYKAPEQWQGRPQQQPADVYSFAVLAYKLIAGELPFVADDPIVLERAVLEAAVPEIKGVPYHVNAAFVKGLAKNPGDRFATCAEFLDAIGGKPGFVPPATTSSKFGKWLPWAAVSVLALVGIVWLSGLRRPQPRASADRIVSAFTLPPGEKAGDMKVVTLPGGAKFTLVWCPPGKFQMGEGSDKHKVVITQGFWIGKYEVTQSQWKSVMGGNPSHFKGDDLPVENVSWKDCQAFCQKTGSRLPTEAEWEYACRAMARGDYGGLMKAMAWYGESQKRGRTHPVGKKLANRWGIHDMHGNVWEWCQDRYDRDYYKGSPQEDPTGPVGGSERVFKGGSWYRYAKYCTVGYRNWNSPDYRFNQLGFRIVVSVDR